MKVFLLVILYASSLQLYLQIDSVTKYSNTLVVTSDIVAIKNLYVIKNITYLLPHFWNTLRTFLPIFTFGKGKFYLEINRGSCLQA